MQWVQDPSLSNVKPEANRHFRNNKKEAKIEELKQKDEKIRDFHRGIKDFKKG